MYKEEQRINATGDIFYFIFQIVTTMTNQTCWDDEKNTAAWDSFESEKIPTKKDRTLPFGIITKHVQKAKDLSVLDMGCGNGDFLLDLMKTLDIRSACGIDVNAHAIEHANKLSDKTNVSFLAVDILRHQIPDTLFDLVTLQLVISVIGSISNRHALIENAYKHLKPNGYLYLSVSGVSDDINPEYKKLYDEDEQLTGEKYTYFSRDPESNKILYQTHHFSVDEITNLLQEAGFSRIELQDVIETSSRRSDQQARFFYIVAHKGLI
jgi:ubiquinone/menaquinone biosynthesis C-methylase UbiE